VNLERPVGRTNRETVKPNLLVSAESLSDHICEGRHGFEDVDEAVVHRAEVSNQVAPVPAEVQDTIIRIDVDAPEWAAISKVPRPLLHGGKALARNH
jgi:hypothetical protein